MSKIREKINSHLPIVLEFLRTASLVVIALCAICGSKSLKTLSESHKGEISPHIHNTADGSITVNTLIPN